VDLKDYEGMADKLYNIYKQSDSGTYMVERIKSRFYGNMVKDYIPDFNELYALLEAGDHGPKNPIVTGDSDEGAWLEKAPDEYTRVIAIQRYCSCADDNTHIFVLRQFDWEPPEGFTELEHALLRQDNWTTFRCFTAWPRQKKSKYGGNWGDHRDIEVPSINTHRKHKFNFGYGDGRDEHYCFKYDSMQGRAEDAYWKESRLLWALRSLRDGLNSIKIEAEWTTQRMTKD